MLLLRLISVGAASDPIDRPGLAHFTEHAVFLGNHLLSLLLPLLSSSITVLSLLSFKDLRSTRKKTHTKSF